MVMCLNAKVGGESTGCTTSQPAFKINSAHVTKIFLYELMGIKSSMLGGHFSYSTGIS